MESEFKLTKRKDCSGLCPKCCKKNVCCGQKMIEENIYINDEDRTSYVCKVCGAFRVITTGTLDEEEIKQYKEVD